MSKIKENNSSSSVNSTATATANSSSSPSSSSSSGGRSSSISNLSGNTHSHPHQTSSSSYTYKPKSSGSIMPYPNNQSSNVDETPMALLEQLVYMEPFMTSGESEPADYDEKLNADLAAFVTDDFIFPDEDKPKVKPEDGNDNLSGWTNHEVSANSINNNPITHSSSSNINSSNNHPSSLSSFTATSFNHISPSTTSVTPSPSINNGVSRTIPSTIHELLQQQSSSSSYNGFRQQEVVSQNTIQHQHSETIETSYLPKVHVPQGAQNTLVAAGLTEVQIEALAKLIAFHKPDILPGSDANSSTFNGAKSV
ncbi:unnamed protein product [Ambrosiozyma monospora]|uniref:Unnamed protein product n=1 Tax=Ambrosiozyma monospora TaxID=43982 RepID=A0ACB5SUU3_AMBMO|nr:unnamed protein product [Ambrosiozyma monospora]